MRFVIALIEVYAAEGLVRRGNNGNGSELSPDEGTLGRALLHRQRLTRYLGIRVLKDGKKVDKCLNQLIKDRLVWQSKKGATVSLNPHRSVEISSFIDRFLKE